MEQVIVTGANGFIGSSLIRKLVEDNIQVIAIDISFANSRLPESNLITKVESIDQLKLSIPSVNYDAFYHFAWRGVNGSDKADPEIQAENIKITLRCAKLAKELNCKKFLCSGTIAEQAVNSLSHLGKTSGGMMYSASKCAAHMMLETYCKNIGLPFVWMQFSNIYGPENKTGNLVSYTLDCLESDKEATFGPALQPYDFIFVDDLIEAVYRLGKVTNNHNSYYLGSGEPRILKDYLLEIGKLAGKEDKIKIGARPDDGIVYSLDMFDTSLLKNDIGEYVSTSFTEGIKKTITAYLEG